MEKLIELLTEHCRKHYGFKDNDDIEIDHDSVQFHLYHNAKRCFSIGVEKVISKEFGFIDWLVDNDKIDIDKLKFQSDFMFPLWKDFDQMGSEDIEEYSEYESLLMILSISDTPIEDLISYLK